MQQRTNATYARELGRAGGGAILFAFPLLMTVEMWSIGFFIDEGRLLLFLIVGFLLLLGLSRIAGFEPEESWSDVVLDMFSAYAVAVLIAAFFLAIFGTLTTAMPAREVIGKVALASLPAAIGALVARKQFRSIGETGDDRFRTTYLGEMFLMFAGAVFVAFNVAPTDEVALISHLMSPAQAIGLAMATVLIQHALVYTVEFRGQEIWPTERKFFAVFLPYTVSGYGIALAVACYILWTFGRTDGMSMDEIATMTVVLGFPAALGAATARLVI